MARILLAIEAVREVNMNRRRRSEIMREEFDYALIPDPEFVKKYRLNKTLFEELCVQVVPLLPKKVNRNAVDPCIKILTALNFFARGSYQGAVGNNSDAPMAQQTVSRCIKEVLTALNDPRIVGKYIKFPQNRRDRTKIKSRFYEKYGIPGIVGCIDCTHVAIIRPSENEERFYNRKSYHSINVQMICDADNYVLNVDASFGGATHDSFIWNESEIRQHLESLATQGEMAFLLGDSGYPLSEYLITPFGEVPENSPEGQFNQVHKKAQSTIERTFGIIKGRFRCLLAARELNYCPEVAGFIIIACSVLHNMCLRDTLEYPELNISERAVEMRRQPAEVLPPPSPALALQRGVIVRANLVAHLTRNQ